MFCKETIIGVICGTIKMFKGYNSPDLLIAETIGAYNGMGVLELR